MQESFWRWLSSARYSLPLHRPPVISVPASSYFGHNSALKTFNQPATLNNNMLKRQQTRNGNLTMELLVSHLRIYSETQAHDYI